MTREEMEQLIHKQGLAIYGFCFHLTGNRDEADDLYQDTLLKAYEIRSRIKHDDLTYTYQTERNYCMGIAVRLFKNRFRRNRKCQVLLLEDLEKNTEKPFKDENTPEKLTEERIRNEKIREEIEKLPLKQKTVIYLFFFANLSISEIGKVLKIPEGTVKSRLNTAKSNLKEKLGGYFDGE